MLISPLEPRLDGIIHCYLVPLDIALSQFKLQLVLYPVLFIGVAERGLLASMIVT